MTVPQRFRRESSTRLPLLERPLSAYWLTTRLLLVVAILGVTVSATAQKPLPAEQKGYTHRQYKQDFNRFRRELAEIYRQRTTDAGPVKTMGTLFLLRYCQRSSLLPGAPDWPELLNEGTQVVNAGSRDPIILSVTGYTLIVQGRHQEAREMLADAWERFDELGYPARCRVFPAMWLRTTAVQTIDEPAINRWDDESMKALIEWMREEDLSPERLCLVWGQLHSLMWQPMRATVESRKRVYDALADDESIDPWMRHMLSGAYHYKLAWHERGKVEDRPYREARRNVLEDAELDSSEVKEAAPDQDAEDADGSSTQQPQKTFAELLAISAESYRAAYDLRPDIPIAANRMIQVALHGGDSDSPRAWFDRAVAEQFDYMDAYAGMMRVLEPAYGGSNEALLAFGVECAETKRYDTNIPWVLLEVVETIDRTDRDAKIWKRQEVYENCRTVLRGMAAEPNRSEERCYVYHHTWAKNKLFAIAMRAGNYVHARQSLEALDDVFSANLMYEEKIDISRQKYRVYALSGPGQEQVQEAEKLHDDLQQGAARLDRMTQLLQKARDLDEHPRSRHYIRNLSQLVQLEREFYVGDWVALNFDENLSTWYNQFGAWDVVDQQTVFGGDMEHDRGTLLQQRAKFPGPYIVECNVDSLFTHAAQHGAGFMIGDYNNANPLQSKFLAFVADTHRNTVSFSTPYAFPYVGNYQTPKQVRLRVKIADGYFELYADGHYIASARSDRVRTGPTLAIGTPLWFIESGEVKYSDVRIRQWRLGPPPVESENEARMAYYTKAVKEEPDNPHVWQMLGFMRYEQQDYPAAIEALERSHALPQFGIIGTREILGDAYMKVSDYGNASEHLIWAVRESHQYDNLDSNKAMNACAWLFATSPYEHLRNGKYAVSLAKKACDATENKNPRYLQTLAAAHAEQGEFEQARQVIDAAIELTDAGQRAEIQAQRRLYEQGQPFRLPTVEEKAAATRPAA